VGVGPEVIDEDVTGDDGRVLSAAGDGVHKVQGAVELAALHEAAHAHVALPPLGAWTVASLSIWW
jgi:hypothetical protein